MTALILTLVASFFLLKGNLGLTPDIIAKLSSTVWGYNKEVAAILAGQSTDTYIGFILLLLAFVLQSINLLWPMRWCDMRANPKGILISIAFCLIVFLILYMVSNKLSNNMLKRSVDIVKNAQPLNLKDIEK
jgi:hypothetical protein